ncbi:MAG: hypothetical protein JKP98_14485 [Rhodobacteraceae bacterium]|nr:hypothetical protein [Paracoccaceae bacterium]
MSWAEIEKRLAARVYPVEGDLTEAEAERYGTGRTGECRCARCRRAG